MCNSFKSVKEILDNYSKINKVSLSLENHQNYWAHTPKTLKSSPETLSEHIDLVQKYLERIVEHHGLDRIVDNIIESYLKEKDLFPSLGNFIKELFVSSILYHDHGKVNENFQIEKMKNPFFEGKSNIENDIGSQHSTLSAFIFLNHQINNILTILKGNEINCAVTISVLISYSIYQHHSFSLKNDFKRKIIKETKRVEELISYLQLFKNKNNDLQALQLLAKVDRLFGMKEFNRFGDSFALYQLIRLNFSLLTASDYLATHEFSNQSEIKDFGTFTQLRICELYVKVTQSEWINESAGKINFNKNTYDSLEVLNLNVKPTRKSAKNLNCLRQQMATEAIRNLKQYIDKNLFYLEAPTGGGKTNISMLLTLELLKANQELNKVYYVFPFTTLIDQTFHSLKESLGLSEREIVALHSRVSFNSNSENDEKDAKYGSIQKDYINRLFVNFPFTLLSHVNFFDILKTNRKEKNYLLHRLANAVVVIDELQSYNPEHWDKILFFINKYAELYNIKFILMSATLPKISNLNIDKVSVGDFVYLLPNAKRDYFNNINFSGRVSFDYSLSKGRISLEELAQKVLDESKAYAAINGGTAKPKNSVYTVVEFIFKNATTLFGREIRNINDGFFDEIFILSGTILPHRRRYIINNIKNRDSRNKKILLITTQVVEAGVDIDMDLGFKDSSLLDSDEQLAGRINRNVNKDGCKLFLFNYSPEGLIYGKDLRYDFIKELSKEEKENILNEKNFDYLYQRVIDFKNERNQDHNFVGIHDYLNTIKNLQYGSASNDFKLIEQENFSCFIPMNIPVLIEGSSSNEFEEVFNTSELKFLAENGIFPNADNQILGELVFDLYLQLIDSQESFFSRNIEIKQLQSIISKYTFSLFSSEKNKNKLIEFMDVAKSEYGYFYMNRWEGFYSEESGIDEFAFESIENQFI